MVMVAAAAAAAAKVAADMTAYAAVTAAV